MVNILLVDDHQIVRKQLHHVLEHDDWHICAEAADGQEAVDKFVDSNPDITVMDFLMPKMNGLEASREIMEKYPGSPILMLSIDTSDELMREAKKVGIRGICSKAQIMRIVDAVTALLNGGTYYEKN